MTSAPIGPALPPTIRAARRLRATLADLFRDPKNVNAKIDDPVVRAAMLKGERMVLDDAATTLAVQLSQGRPADMRRMLDQIEFPDRPLWVEFSARMLFEARRALGGLIDPDDETERSPAARTALMIKPGEDDPSEINLWIVEEPIFEPIMVWPLGFVIYPADRAAGKNPHAVWGYADHVDMGPLRHRGAFVMTASKKDRLAEGIAVMARELSGASRLAVAVLAMLQTVTLAGDPVRAPGSVRMGGRIQPNLSTRHLSLQVPHRIRNVAAYARRRLAEEATHRKRLHEVREHYRHLDHQPRAPGWAPILVEGQTFWRKRIAGHLRGDPSLGVVEHDVTVVHGPRA